MKLKVSRKYTPNIIDRSEPDSRMYFIKSGEGEGDAHYLFLEWDAVIEWEETVAESIGALASLEVPGLLIRTPRGYHFISSKKMTFLETIILQNIFNADSKWVGRNRERGFSVLRISIKYPDEIPLYKKIDSHPFTDSELKAEYERLVKRYFDRGEPYMVDSDVEIKEEDIPF